VICSDGATPPVPGGTCTCSVQVAAPLPSTPKLPGSVPTGCDGTTLAAARVSARRASAGGWPVAISSVHSKATTAGHRRRT